MQPDVYAVWLAQTRAAGPLDRSAMRDLLHRGVLSSPKAYESVSGDPFAAVVRALKSGRPVQEGDGA